MSQFPSRISGKPVGATIHPGHIAVATCQFADLSVVNFAAAAWPAANRAIYVPFTVEAEDLVQQMFWENGGVAGTTDVGIYDITGTRLVSLGPTTNAGTIQIGNITDTTLPRGNYYMAMLVSTTVTATFWSAVVGVPMLRMAGCQQEAVGSATLPATATFAAITSAYLPMVGISYQSVM